MAKRLTFDVLIRTAFQGAVRKGTDYPTKSELARRLGVSRSSVTRWLAGGVPSDATRQRIGSALRRDYQRVKRTAERINRRAKAAPPEQAIPIAGKRTMINERDRYGDETGRQIPSDWVNYDVSTYDVQTIFDFLRGMAKMRRGIQIVYRVPAGGTSLGGREYTKTGRAATSPIELHPSMTDMQLWQETLAPFHEHPGKPLRVLFVAALEPL